MNTSNWIISVKVLIRLMFLQNFTSEIPMQIIIQLITPNNITNFLLQISRKSLPWMFRAMQWKEQRLRPSHGPNRGDTLKNPQVFSPKYPGWQGRWGQWHSVKRAACPRKSMVGTWNFFPLGMVYFQGLMWVSGRVMCANSYYASQCQCAAGWAAMTNCGTIGP